MVDDDLTVSLTGLAGLLTDHRPLSDTLTEIAQFAVNAIPGADGAGLTMLEDDRHQTVVSSAEFVRAVDDIQYGVGEGPCIAAVASRQTQTSGSLGGEPAGRTSGRGSAGLVCTASCRYRCYCPSSTNPTG